MDLDLAEVARIVDGEMCGANVRVRGLGIPTRAEEGDLVVVKHTALLRPALLGRAAALVVRADVKHVTKPTVRVASPVQALVRLLSYSRRSRQWSDAEPGISPDARLGRNVALGADVWLAPYVVIGDNVRIADRAKICPHVVIGDDVTIGKDTLIYPMVTIYPDVHVGDRVIIHSGTVIGADGFNFEDDQGAIYKVPSTGTVIIEDDVEIGANCCADRAVYGATRIGRHSKLDNCVHIAHDVQTGERCGFAGQAAVAGDATLGDGVVLMGRAGVADSITVASKTMILAQSVVTRDTEEGQVYLGFPALPHIEQKRIWRALRDLPALLDDVRRRSGDPTTR
jgi:UDP-3-O-[3-hydroxymyristoyl] glucosamine N-acyltransferase